MESYRREINLVNFSVQFRNHFGLDLVHTCRNWGAVYRAVEANQDAFVASGRRWQDFWNEYD